MRIAGIIAEYNPFHRGHAWHIARTREAGCDRVIVCMDGHFTQRGEAAILSRWDRARMALACGADAVFELPTLFAVRTADAFARGGVGILAGLGVDVLSFGSEITDRDPLLICDRFDFFIAFLFFVHGDVFFNSLSHLGTSSHTPVGYP